MLEPQPQPEQSLSPESFQEELDRKVRELLELFLEENGLFTLIDIKMEEGLISTSILDELAAYSEEMSLLIDSQFTLSIRERVDRSESTKKGADIDTQLVEKGADIGAVITIRSKQAESATEIVLNLFGDVRSVVNRDLADKSLYGEGHAQRTDQIMNLQTQVNLQVKVDDNQKMDMWCLLSPEGSDVLFVTQLRFSKSGSVALELRIPFRIESDDVSYVFRKTGKNLRNIVRGLIELKNRAKSMNRINDA